MGSSFWRQEGVGYRDVRMCSSRLCSLRFGKRDEKRDGGFSRFEKGDGGYLNRWRMKELSCIDNWLSILLIGKTASVLYYCFGKTASVFSRALSMT